MEYSATSLSELAQRYVRDQVLSGAMKSGDKIIEADVSQALEISRAPVREAFRSLNEQGLLSYSPRKGHILVDMPRDEILEVFQIRISLELQVLRLIVTNKLLSAADYEALSDFARRMEDGEKLVQTEQERVYLLNTMDLSFHKRLWTVSGSKRRAQLLENLFLQLLVVMNRNIQSLGSYKEKAEEHWQMIEALRTEDPARVCLELKNHLKKYIIAALSPLSDSEIWNLNILFSA